MLDVPAESTAFPATDRALDVRLARSAAEREAASALRYRVFFEEHGARADALCRLAQRDVDAYDSACDHLIVVDRRSNAVVGNYRLLRRSVAMRRDGFYSAQEFDLAPLLAQSGELLELGRSCIDPRYRTGGTMALLWQGIAKYVFAHGVELMFGCASFHGTDAAQLAAPLAYLHANHLAPADLRPKALAHRRLALPAAAPGESAKAMLPPLIKGYLRLGGFIGDGAVVDQAFDTTDVCVVVKTRLLVGRYQRHYARQAELVAA